MDDEKEAYCEPIEDSDMNLEKKFKGAPKPRILDKKVIEDAREAEKKGAKEKAQMEKDRTYNKILANVKQHAPSKVNAFEVKEDAKKVDEATDANSKIQNLVDLSIAKGVIHAVKVARRLEDNYVLDMFHDKLMAEELHDALAREGLIKSL